MTTEETPNSEPSITTKIQFELSVGGGGYISTGVFQPLITETSSNGEFSTSFVPSSSGVYTITVLFSGNDTYEASSAQTSVTVKDDYTTLIIVLVIVAIIVFVYYFLQKKSNCKVAIEVPKAYSHYKR